MKDCCIILNPNARAVARGEVHRRLREAAPEARLWVTSRAGEAEELAREAVRLGIDTVVAAGGDGTVNEVLRGVVGAPVRLGVLPVGTMNVFAREHGIPLDWEEAWHRIRRGTERRVDVGWANAKPFAQLAGVGLDAEVVAAVGSEAKRWLGPLAYVAAAMRLVGRPAPSFWVEGEGVAATRGRWVLVGMGRYYGGAIPVFPWANPGDGLMDVLVVKDLSIPALASYVAGLPMGWHTRVRGVEYFQTRKLRVVGDGALELDGEAMGRAPVEFGVSPGVLRLAGFGD